MAGILPAERDVSWRLSNRADLSLKTWADGTVVFNDVDGHLQCLNPAFGQVLELLALGSPRTALELAHELLCEAPGLGDMELVENALKTLASSNLIVRVAV